MAKAESQKPADNWKEIFITALLKSSNVAAACRKAKISRSYAYAQKNLDAEFRDAWDEALMWRPSWPTPASMAWQ